MGGPPLTLVLVAIEMTTMILVLLLISFINILNFERDRRITRTEMSKNTPKRVLVSETYGKRKKEHLIR